MGQAGSTVERVALVSDAGDERRSGHRRQVERVLELAGHLGVKDAFLVRQVYECGLKVADIARQAGCDRGRIYLQLRSALRRLRSPLFAAIELTDAAFSTSGDYERFFMRDGLRYHHILDPDTGEPAQRSRSVTIMATNSTVADGLSTGVFVLGAEQGMALIEKLPDVEGVIVTSNNHVQVSSGLKGRLVLLKPPTDAP